MTWPFSKGIREMSKALVVKYWVTEDGVFGRVPARGLCLQAETLQELSAIIEGQGEASAGVMLTPGEELPEEVYP